VEARGNAVEAEEVGRPDGPGGRGGRRAQWRPARAAEPTWGRQRMDRNVATEGGGEEG
jgi:hypothetical protein